MKKFLNIMLPILLSAVIAGCGAASAPPVDLPAPVTGQIDISAPSAEGKSTVTGNAGAVPGGSFVMVINERLEVAQNASPLLKLMDALVPTAYAAAPLPDICEQAGHWCIIAEGDGSFVLTIDAFINDSIVIVIIDGQGVEISERLVRSVPASDNDIVACPNMGVDGKLADLANPGGIPLGLYEGSDDSSNTLLMTDPNSGESKTIPLPGCYASGFTFLPYTDPGGRVVVISSEDQLMWIGTWNGENFIYSQTYTLEGIPISITSVGEDNYVAVTFKKTDRLAVAIVSANDGSTVMTYDITNPSVPTSAPLTKLVAMRSIGPFVDDSFMIGLLMQTDALNSYITLLDSSNLNDLGNIWLAPGTFFFTDLTDMEFAIGDNELVYALIDNYGDGAVHVRGFTDGSTTIALSTSLSGLAPIMLDSLSSVQKDITYTDVSPKRIAVSYDTAGKAITYVITGTDSVLKISDFLTPIAEETSFYIVSGASAATDIATNPDDDHVIIGNGLITDITDDLL